MINARWQSSKSGGRSSTQFGSSNPSVPQDMDRTNKSSTCITFIGGSTAAGHPLPPHFQLKSVATDENKRIQKKSSTVFRLYMECTTGMTLSRLDQLLIAMHLLVWMQLSFESLSLTLLFHDIQTQQRRMTSVCF